MKKQVYKMIKLMLAFMLVLTAVTLMVNKETHAEVAHKKSIMLKTTGIDCIRQPSLENSWDTLYYGKYNDLPLQWNILNSKENGFGATNSILLLSTGLVGKSAYGNMMTVDYGNSTLRSYVQAIVNSTNNVSSKEKDNIVVSQKAGTGPYVGISDPQIDDKFFAPTATMLRDSQYGFKTATDLALPEMYWLSSHSFIVSYNAAGVDINGTIHNTYTQINSGGVRIASNINSSSLMMISDAVGSKPKEIVSTLSEVNESDSHEYKLTMKDNAQTIEVPTNMKVCGDEVLFDYSSSGDGQYLSAIMTNETGDEILSYGKVKDISTDKVGTASIKLPEDFFINKYKLKIFTEIDNGDKATDFSSDIIDVNVPTPYTVTFQYRDIQGEEIGKKVMASEHVDITAYMPLKETILKDVKGYRLEEEWEWVLEPADGDFSDVTKSFVAVPSYIKTWEVKYLDAQQQQIGIVQVIDDGKDATIPIPPIKDLYHFKEWNQASTRITEDKQIQAIYTPYVYSIQTAKNKYIMGQEQIKTFLQTRINEDERFIQLYQAVLYEGETIQPEGIITVKTENEELKRAKPGPYNLVFQYTNPIDKTFQAEKVVVLEISEKQGIVSNPVIPEKPGKLLNNSDGSIIVTSDITRDITPPIILMGTELVIIVIMVILGVRYKGNKKNRKIKIAENTEIIELTIPTRDIMSKPEEHIEKELPTLITKPIEMNEEKTMKTSKDNKGILIATTLSAIGFLVFMKKRYRK